jgi:hypothetical protein
MTVRRLKRSRWAFATLFVSTTLASGFSTRQQPERHEFPPDIWHASYQIPPGHDRKVIWLDREIASDELARELAEQFTEFVKDEKSKAIEALGESPLAAVFEAIGPDARLFAQHNITLANPFMEGRVPGSNGNRVAADYIEYYYRHLGLNPAFPATAKATDGSEVVTSNATYRQPFQHGSDLKVTTQTVTLHPTGKEDMKLVPGKDFTVLGMSGSGQIKGDVIVCGYGIEEGPNGYKGFHGDTDLTGKIALVMRFEPMDEKGNSRWAEEGWSPAASLDAKLEAVSKRNPAAIILVNPPGANDPRAKDLISLKDSPARGRGGASKIPIVMVTTEAADRLVSFTGTLATFRERADEAGGLYKVTDTRASINVEIARDPIMTDNVGAILPGKGDLADEYIVIGAHYDHVGYGPNGVDAKNEGKLHPGADDNASGTSGLLVLAEKMKAAYAALPDTASARSVLFLTFTAEEAGLIGSRWFVNHPSIELSKIYIMLNMDMIGRLRAKEGLEVQGTQTAEGLYDWLKPHFDASGIEIKHGMEVAGNSDHASFYSKKLPVLFFFTGLHRQYHKPEDTFDLINQVGAAKVVGLTHNIAMGLAQRTEPLPFKAREREDRAQAPARQSPGPTAGRVRFGIAPASYSDDKPGVEVGDVYEGTSAADAGIKIGDRMIKWNGKPLTDVESWMPLLSSHKVGDEVEVTLIRDGKEMAIKVKLKGREPGNR